VIKLQLTSPRREAPVELTVAKGTTIEEAYRSALDENLLQAPAHQPLMAFVDHHARDLRHQLEIDARVDLRGADDGEGMRAYRRAVRLLLIAAVIDTFPDKTVYIDHSLSGGFFGVLRQTPRAGETDGRLLLGPTIPCSPDDVTALEGRMRELVAADEPIELLSMKREEAAAEFERLGDRTKATLLRHMTKPAVELYRVGGILDSFYGPIAPRTGLLKHFDLVFYPPGFVLRFPTHETPTKLAPFQEQKKLFHIFHEYEDWIKVLGAETVGGLDHLIARDDYRELVLLAEALHEKKIAQIADTIAGHHHPPRVILIAGPSSSGKTTFTKRLEVQLTVIGHRPCSISVDDYFLPREQTPLDEQGEPDFERLEAINVEALNRDLLTLLDGGKVHPPRFDFKRGRSEPSPEPLCIDENTPLILEGIHCLNDELTRAIPTREKFKIYVSCLTQLNIDNHNRVPTTDTRLIRRICRDARYRGYDALQTLRRWSKVRRGESRYIFPFQETADVMFNSALIYELAVLGKHIRPLLAAVPEDAPERAEADRLLSFIAFFLDLPDKAVPHTSLLREFIGGSVFRGE
jgi:uridine kinase